MQPRLQAKAIMMMVVRLQSHCRMTRWTCVQIFFHKAFFSLTDCAWMAKATLELLQNFFAKDGSAQGAKDYSKT